MSKNLDAVPSQPTDNEPKTFRYYSQIEAEQKRKESTTNLSMKLPKPFYARFRDACIYRKVSMVSVVKSLIEDWLIDNEI